MQQTRKHFNPIEAAKYPPPTAKSPWCVRFPVATQREGTAKARLIVFCHAGGNSASYRPWDALLTPEVTLLVIELPGRLTRFKDPLISDIPTIVKQSVEQGIVSYLDRPFFLFGHSFGSLVAFEVARYLQKTYNISPLCLFVSSHESPMKPPSQYHKLPDKALIDHLIVTYKDTQLEKARREYPDLLEMVTPAIRADITANEKYVYTPGPGLQCPIVFFLGQEEHELTSKDSQEWKSQSIYQDKFEERKFPGGHFYLNTDTEGFMTAFNAYLKKFVMYM